MECPICQENLIEGHGGPIAIGCGHTMHKDCSLQWFKTVEDGCPITCPLCREPTAANKMIALQFKRKTLSSSTSSRVQRFREQADKNQWYFLLRKRLLTVQKELVSLQNRRSR